MTREKKFCDKMRSMDQSAKKSNKKAGYEGHFYFVDCPRLNNLTLDWMNLMRDPVDRFVSGFFYLRLNSRWKKRPTKPPEVSQYIELNFIQIELS